MISIRMSFPITSKRYSNLVRVVLIAYRILMME